LFPVESQEIETDSHAPYEGRAKSADEFHESGPPL
jgi:hypothetical protein